MLKGVVPMAIIHFNKKEQYKDYENVGNIVKKIISEKGLTCLEDTDAFVSLLKEKKVDTVLAMQLGLLLEAGNIKSYLTQVKTGITMIDVNNMVTCAEAQTGLSKKSVKYLLTVMLYGLSLPSEIATLRIPDESSYKQIDTALVNRDKYTAVLRDLRSAVNDKNEETVAENAAVLAEMVSAGIPEALYLKAVCYIEGIATEADHQKGFRYMQSAASAGVPEANAYLGDYYFEDDILCDYTTAFNYYTQIGAVAMSKERKQNLKVIVAAKRQNITQLILNGILLVLIYVFNVLVGKGGFSYNGAAHWGWAVTSMVLTTLIYGLQIAQLVFRRYNRTKWATAAMMVILALTTILAL